MKALLWLPRKATRFLFLFLLFLGLAGLLAGEVEGASREVDLLQVEGNIVPVVADYLDRAIGQAESRGAMAVIIRLNTPGGLLDSTQKIVERIMNAKVPVVIWVAPSGARAASAGVFITLSAHVAAMASGTSIGAAHPVALSPTGGEMPETMKEKVTEYSVAWIKSIAEKRGRNVEWAEAAVRGSASLTDREALEKNVIDVRADDINSLLSQLDGRRVMIGEEEVVIDTQGCSVRENPMNFIERFLHAISDPNIAYILLSIGSLGIIVELYHPGIIIPGVTGAICLLMAFYSLSVLNAFWAGVLLFLLGFALLALEPFIASHGALAVGGVAALVIGSLITFTRGPSGFGLGLDWWLIAVVAGGALAFSAFVLQAVVRVQRRKQPTGPDGMLGATAVVKTRLCPRGTVVAHGELWEAILDEGEAEPGEEVIITEVKGLKLKVTKPRESKGS